MWSADVLWLIDCFNVLHIGQLTWVNACLADINTMLCTLLALLISLILLFPSASPPCLGIEGYSLKAIRNSYIVISLIPSVTVYLKRPHCEYFNLCALEQFHFLNYYYFTYCLHFTFVLFLSMFFLDWLVPVTVSLSCVCLFCSPCFLSVLCQCLSPVSISLMINSFMSLFSPFCFGSHFFFYFGN